MSTGNSHGQIGSAMSNETDMLQPGPLMEGMQAELMLGLLASHGNGSASLDTQEQDQAWANGPVAQEWLGRYVMLRRPPAAITSTDENWGSRGPLYRAHDQNGYLTPPKRGGDIADFFGRMTGISLEAAGTIVIDYGGKNGAEITELFEPITDYEKGYTTGFVPRVSVEELTGHALRQARRSRRKVRLQYSIASRL